MAESDDNKIVKVVELRAPLARVWKALTDHNEFGHWFRVDLDQRFQVGSKSTGRMTYPGHEGVPWVAYIDRMEPQRLFAFRWYDSDDGLREYEDQPALLVEFQLVEIPNGTRLTITESGFSALPHLRRIEVMRANQEGWDIQAENLTRYLSA